MTDDPLTDLRTALVNAASDRARPHRRRRRMLLAAGATAILVPATAAATGLIGGDPSQGTLPDRSSFRVSTVPDPRGPGSCERVEYRDTAGKLLASNTGCPASSGPAPDGELPTSVSAAPSHIALLLGRTPPGTARVDVPAAIGAVAFDPAAFRFAAQVPLDEPPLAIARDADGHELARFSMAAMQSPP